MQSNTQCYVHLENFYRKNYVAKSVWSFPSNYHRVHRSVAPAEGGHILPYFIVNLFKRLNLGSKVGISEFNRISGRVDIERLLLKW